MKFYYLRCLNQDGQTERNGNFLDRKEAEKEKAALDLYPENKRYGIEQDIIEDSVMDIVKRHPDTNGVLQLTEKELREFTELFFDNKDVVNRVYYDGNCIVVEWKKPDNNEFGQLYLDEVSAILYLANLFELEVK